MPKTFLLFFALQFLFLPPLHAKSQDTLSLWYKAPALNWNEALPIGNGRLGAMVFGGMEIEHLQLNEDTIWAGEKRDRINPLAAENLKKVRELLVEGKPKQAQELGEKTLILVPKRMPPYQPLGDLYLDFSHPAGKVESYVRKLDLNTALIKTSYQIGKVHFTREIFSSAVDQVIVIRLSADQPGHITFTAKLDREADFKTHTLNKDKLVIEGQAIPKGEPYALERQVGVHFQGMLQIIPQGGKIHASTDKIGLEGANSAILLFAAATGYHHKSPAKACDQQVTAAAKKDYALLKKNHILDYQKLFHRVNFHLAAPAVKLPTDERLRRYQAGADDLELESLYFQYGRYLLISSSRPETMAANLQGIWNQKLSPPWGSKYTININTEMNYWLAEVGNLSELHQPLFALIDNALEDGRRVAKKIYGAPGFVIHHNTDLWGHAGPDDGIVYGFWPTGGAWLSLHLWEHYDYTRDKQFLIKRAYPVMKEAAEFFLATMVEDQKGHLITGPSLSPENKYRGPDGAPVRLCMGPTMDTEIIRALFDRLIQASQILQVDSEFRQKLIETKNRLHPFQIGKHGQLMEWHEDYEDADPGHRHISHLFALYPDDQITLRRTPELAQAARISLERRIKAGSGYTGWSRAWIINFWARLAEGNIAHDHIKALIGESTLPNLLDFHPPYTSSELPYFQIDGNLGGSAGIAELLLQTHSGEVSLLPALPKSWPTGFIKGLRAKGAIQVDLHWSEGKLTNATLLTEVSGQHLIRLQHGLKVVAVLENGKRIFPKTDLENRLILNVSANKCYELKIRRIF